MGSTIFLSKLILPSIPFFIFNPAHASPLMTPTALSQLSPRNNITDNGSLVNSLITITPVAFDIALPWWTCIPGTAIDLLIVATAVSGGWVRPTKSDVPTTKKLLIWNWFTTFLLFFQSICGLIHLLQCLLSKDRYSLGLVQRLGGNSFAALFANSIRLWDPVLLDHPKTLLVAGWINITLSLLIFIVLSLPVIGSAPLFQASSPFCSWVLNDGTGYQLINAVSPSSNAVCGLYNWLNDTSLVASLSTSSQTLIRCADADTLRLGYTGAYSVLTNPGLDYPHMMQSPWLGWAFAVAVVVLLALTGIMQRRRKYYRTATEENDKTEDWTGKVVMALFFLSLAISIAVLISQRESQVTGFAGSVVVCPNVANSSTFMNVSNDTCTCVDILRKYDGSVTSVINKEENAAARFLYNFL